MNLQQDVSLKDYTTMRLGGNAKYMAEVTTENELAEAINYAKANSLPTFVLGGGSNTIVRDEGFDGLVIHNRIRGFHIETTDNEVTFVVGAGENWDDIVQKSVAMNLSGIEALSAIPGTVGGAPVQNIGAYGQEIADVLVSVKAYDRQTDAFVTLSADELQLSYRHSILRGYAAGRYIVTEVTMVLSRSAPEPPFYAAVQHYLNEQNITTYTPVVIRDAVVDIRANKLPDPMEFPNAGSFFKNAVIMPEKYGELATNYPDMPSYDAPGGKYKIPTGWLIEQAGLKGRTLHGFRVHDKNTLVLINESATSYNDLVAARQEIISAVTTKFGITIEQEPLELTAASLPL